MMTFLNTLFWRLWDHRWGPSARKARAAKEARAKRLSDPKRVLFGVLYTNGGVEIWRQDGTVERWLNGRRVL